MRKLGASPSIKVAVITHGLFPRIGGIEREVASISPLLQEYGVEVLILTRQLPGTRPFETWVPKAGGPGIPVYRLPASGPKPLASLRFCLAAIPLIRRLQPDLIHAHELISPTTAALVARQAMPKQSRCPVLVTLHNSGPAGDILRMKSRSLGGLRLKALLRAVDGFIVISQEIDAQLAAEGIPVQKRHPINNGVDVRQFSPVNPAARKVLREQLSLSLNIPSGQGRQFHQAIAIHPETELIVFSGRLVPHKRLDMLLYIWPQVRERFPEARLLVLGSGPEETALKHMAQELGLEESICWAGSQSRVAPYLQAADLFVLPSSAEGQAVALLEAMACGLPAVVTSVGGAPEVITHKENGWLLPTGDRPALLEGVLALLGNQNWRKEIGQKARQRILANYSLEETAGRLTALYVAMAGLGGSG